MALVKKYLKIIKHSFFHEFSSLRLAVTLFVLLALSTLVGTILPEEPLVGKEELIKRYGINKYSFLKSLGLTDVFHSFWYLALLVTLGINLTVASFRRVFPRCYLAFAWPIELNEKSIKELPVNCELSLNGGNVLGLINKKLKEKKFRTKINSNKLIAVKGGWHKLGASITHVGILTLLLGSAVGALTGFNGIAQLSSGEGFYLADLKQNSAQVRSTEDNNWIAPVNKMPIWFGRIPKYLIKVNKTWREDYDGGFPKGWYTDLSVLDQDKTELTRKTIYVNNPLEFMGLDIYQSSWGRFIRVSFNNEVFILPLENIKGEEIVFLPLSDDVALKLKTTVGNSDVLELYSLSRELENEKYLGKVKINGNLKLGPLLVSYSGTTTITGLQFKSNPGASLMYPGLVLIILGVFVALGSKKQIWAYIIEGSNTIVMGGKSDKSKGKFFQEFEEIVRSVVEKK